MADAVATNVIASTPTKHIVHLTNVCDNTGETAVKKVDIATLVNLKGVKPDGLRIERVQWAMNGFTSIVLAWDRSAGANQALLLAGTVGALDFTQDTPELGRNSYKDPSTGNADAKGSILLTALQGKAATATYDITLTLALEQNTVAT